MAYMSYCRQQGTFEELKQSLYDVEQYINGNADEAMSDREIESFRKMVFWFVDFLNEQELIDCTGDVDISVLECICDSLRMERKDDEEYSWNPESFL